MNLNKRDEKHKYRSDYKEFDYKIPSIELDFLIENQKINVITKYKLIKKNLNTNKIVLKGYEIYLDKIYLNEKLLEKNEYILNNYELTINGINEETAILQIESSISIKNKNDLLGIYESNNIITTQCEAEGFRRIAFHPDRPDILSKYSVRIIADKEKYPILLSNGKSIGSI